MSNEKKIVFLASRSQSSQFVFNGLKNQIDFTAVIIENPPKKKNCIYKTSEKTWVDRNTRTSAFYFVYHETD